MQKLPIALMVALLVVVSWLGWRAERERKVAADRVTQLEGELAKRGVAIPPAEEAVAARLEPVPVKPTVVQRESVDVGKYLRLIDELRSRTHELEKDLQSVRHSEEEARERIASQAEEGKKLSEQVTNVKEDALRQQRVSEALETELKFKAQRLAQVETSEKLLQDKLGKAEVAAKRVVVVSKDVEDLNRRREASLLRLSGDTGK